MSPVTLPQQAVHRHRRRAYLFDAMAMSLSLAACSTSGRKTGVVTEGGSCRSEGPKSPVAISIPKQVCIACTLKAAKAGSAINRF
jgi:hypothetical protein